MLCSRCEKALNQDSTGKSPVTFDSAQAGELMFPETCTIAVIQQLLDQQRSIEMVQHGQKAKMKPVPRKRKRNTKKRPSYECSSEPESESSDSFDDNYD